MFLAIVVVALGLIVGGLGQKVEHEESFESDKVTFLEDSYALMCAAASSHPTNPIENIASCVACERDEEGPIAERNAAYIRCLQNIDPAALNKCQVLVNKLSAAADLLQAWIDFFKCANNFVYEKFVNACVATMTASGNDLEDFKKIANCVHDRYQNVTATLASALPSTTEEEKKPTEDENTERAQALMTFQTATSCHFSHPNASTAEAECLKCFTAAVQVSSDKNSAVAQCITAHLEKEYQNYAQLTDESLEACIGGVLYENSLAVAVSESNGVIAGTSLANKYLNAVNHVYSQIVKYIQEKAPESIKSYLLSMLELQEPFES